jgi:hypothetical protein
VAVHLGLAELLASTTALEEPRGGAAGAVIGALLAVAAVNLAPRGDPGTWDPARAGEQLL